MMNDAHEPSPKRDADASPDPHADEVGESESAPDSAGMDEPSQPSEHAEEAAAASAERQYAQGDVVTGEVVNIKPYGAFVQLPDGETGLVHISEVDEAYVKDVNDYLSIGQETPVKVVGIHDSGKYNLSIRQLTSRERDSAFHSREMREFSRELEMRRDEIQREARWRRAAQDKSDERPLSREAERAELEAWIEKAREFADETRQKSEDRSRSYPLL